MNFIFKHHSQLTLEDLYTVLQLRSEVYVVEPKSPVREIDGEDLVGETTHLMCFEDDALIAYCRLNPTQDAASISRVIVAETYRGRGIARAMMRAAIAWLQDAGVHTIEVSARAYLRPFYESLGFVPVGAPRYVEAIYLSLLDMKLEAKREGALPGLVANEA